MATETTSVLSHPQSEIISQLIGKVERKRIGLYVKPSQDYRVYAMLESTVRRLRFDLNRLQNVERGKKNIDLGRESRRYSPYLIPRSRVPQKCDRSAIGKSYNGGYICESSVVPKIKTVSPSVENSEDLLGLDGFFKRLKSITSRDSSDESSESNSF